MFLLFLPRSHVPEDGSGPRPITAEEEEDLFGSDDETGGIVDNLAPPVPLVDVDAILDDVFLMHDPEAMTQGTSDVDATPLGVLIPPDVEMLSPMEVDVPVVVDHESDSKPYGRGDGKHTDIFVGRLLEKMRVLPCVAAMPTHLFIPKSLTRRYSMLAVSVLTWWLEEAGGGGIGDRGKAATLFLKVFDTLITRDMKSDQPRSKVHEVPNEEPVHVAQQIRSRIQRLEAGFWLEMLDDLILDSKVQQEKAALRRTIAVAVDTELLSMHNRESCVHKVMNGDARTGRRILESSGLHAPSDVIVDLMRSKFITSASGDTLAGNFDLKDVPGICVVV